MTVPKFLPLVVASNTISVMQRKPGPRGLYCDRVLSVFAGPLSFHGPLHVCWLSHTLEPGITQLKL